MQDRAEQLSEEAIEVIHHMDKVARLSNLAIRLYSYYIKHGHTSNIEDEQRIKDFMAQHLPTDAWELTGFYEKLYLYQSLCWYAFIRQDFLMYYRYSQKWVNLFEEQPLMKRVETGHYIKGLHNLINAHFDLRNHARFDEVLQRFEILPKQKGCSTTRTFAFSLSLYRTGKDQPALPKWQL
jgi:hypothetical protein